MIYLMEYVAFASGSLFCWYMFRDITNVLLTVLVSAPYSTKKRFNKMYYKLKNETYYNLYGRQSLKSYDDYLRVFELSKKTAYASFQRYFGGSLRVTLLQILPITLLPATLFWNNWHLYIVGVFTTLLAMIIYKTFVEEKNVDYYRRSMLFAVLDLYYKNI